MLLINVPKNIDSEEKLKLYKENYLKLKEILSELESQGHDVSYLKTNILDFEPLTKMARLKYDKAIIGKIEKLLLDSFEELKEVVDGNDFENALRLISSCYSDINKKNYKKVVKSYKELNFHYKNLPKEFQKLIYKACLDINEKINENKKDSQ